MRKRRQSSFSQCPRATAGKRPPGHPGWGNEHLQFHPLPQPRSSASSRPTSLAEVSFPAHGTGAQGTSLWQHQAGGRDVAGRRVAGIPLVRTRWACSRKGSLSRQHLEPTAVRHALATDKYLQHLLMPRQPFSPVSGWVPMAQGAPCSGLYKWQMTPLPGYTPKMQGEIFFAHENK